MYDHVMESKERTIKNHQRPAAPPAGTDAQRTAR
jgi:hypothetical protein